MNSKILVFGATSAIARAAIARWAESGAEFLLVARNAKRIEHVAMDARARGAGTVESRPLDLAKIEAIAPFFESNVVEESAWDLILIAHGVLPDQLACERNPAHADSAIRTNFSSPIQICLHAARVLESRKQGCLMVITSVSGDRARRDSMVYSATKAGLSTFLTGLRLRLGPAGVAVIDVRPGFIDTPMTAHLRKSILFAKPEQVARDMDRAWKRGRDAVLYTPRFWRFVMLVIRNLPTAVFRRISPD